MIKVYIYKNSNGLMVGEYVGNPDEVLKDIPSDCDFTLAEPINYRQPWYWINDKWQLKEEPTEEGDVETN